MPDGRPPHHPQWHRLDRRADQLIADSATDDDANDDLLSTAEVARWLKMSEVWLEIGRSKGYGPRFVVLNPKRIRYRRCDLIAWLRSRTYSCTDQYAAVVVGLTKTNVERVAARAALAAPVKKVWGFKRGTT